MNSTKKHDAILDCMQGVVGYLYVSLGVILLENYKCFTTQPALCGFALSWSTKTPFFSNRRFFLMCHSIVYNTPVFYSVLVNNAFVVKNVMVINLPAYFTLFCFLGGSPWRMFLFVVFLLNCVKIYQAQARLNPIWPALNELNTLYKNNQHEAGVL